MLNDSNVKWLTDKKLREVLTNNSEDIEIGVPIGTALENVTDESMSAVCQLILMGQGILTLDPQKRICLLLSPIAKQVLAKRLGDAN